MANAIFESLSKQRVDEFRAAFAASRELFYDEDARRLRHSGEFGAYREKVCADFLRLFLPSYLDIGTGFLINNSEGISTQCDLVIFDPQYTPYVEDAKNRRFFPVETVVAIAEIKSALGKQELLDALIKLARIKQLRHIEGLSPVRRSSKIPDDQVHHYDFMASFLICERFTFDLKDITADLTKWYNSQDVQPEYRHNLVLSINDGVFCYKNSEFKRGPLAWPSPIALDKPMKNRFVFPGENSRNHFGVFTAYLFSLCAHTTVYMPEIGKYDAQVLGTWQDEK